MGKYQAILLDNPNVRLQVTSALNPATLLPTEATQSSEPNCPNIMELVCSSRPKLGQPDLELFTDGEQLHGPGRRCSGYAVITPEKTAERRALPPGSSAQKAEIFALTSTLFIAEGMWVNIYTDSRSAFSMVHAHGAIWKERGLLTSNNKDIKHTSEILSLLEAIHKPLQEAVMHRPGHQRGETHIIKRNQLAEQAAKKAIIKP